MNVTFSAKELESKSSTMNFGHCPNSNQFTKYSESATSFVHSWQIMHTFSLRELCIMSPKCFGLRIFKGPSASIQLYLPFEMFLGGLGGGYNRAILVAILEVHGRATYPSFISTFEMLKTTALFRQTFNFNLYP